MDGKTKATYKRKDLFSAHSFRELEPLAIIAGSVATGRQAGRVLQQWLRASILIHKHKAE